MPAKKRSLPNPEWSKFVQGYKKAKNISLKDAMKECGGPSGAFAKWKREHQKYGGSVLDSINDFLWKFVAAPLGRAVRQGVRNRWGFGEDREEYDEMY